MADSCLFLLSCISIPTHFSTRTNRIQHGWNPNSYGCWLVSAHFSVTDRTNHVYFYYFLLFQWTIVNYRGNKVINWIALPFDFNLQSLWRKEIITTQSYTAQDSEDCLILVQTSISKVRNLIVKIPFIKIQILYFLQLYSFIISFWSNKLDFCYSKLSTKLRNSTLSL